MGRRPIVESDRTTEARWLVFGRAIALPALMLVVVVLAISSYYPFHWDPPRVKRNEVSRTAQGTMRFGNMNTAVSSGTPAWLDEARAAERIEIRLEARAGNPGHPVSIMMLARSSWETDFAIGQDHADLMVWFRRVGSNDNGDPAFRVSGVFSPWRWATVDLRARGGRLRVDVDGVPRLSTSLPDGSMRRWDGGRIALGDELNGGGPWQGEIRKAEVRTLGYAVDYVRPGALAIPARRFSLPDHYEPFPPNNAREWMGVPLHFIEFVPVGFLLLVAWPRRVRPLVAALLATGIAVALTAGRLLFLGRHIAVTDVVVSFVGALLGARLAAWMLVRAPGPTSGSRGSVHYANHD